MPKNVETIKCTGDLAPASAPAQAQASAAATAAAIACPNNIMVLWIRWNVCHVAHPISMCESDWQNSRGKWKRKLAQEKYARHLSNVGWFVYSFGLLACLLSSFFIYCANKERRLNENICTSFYLSISFGFVFSGSVSVSVGRTAIESTNRTTRS